MRLMGAALCLGLGVLGAACGEEDDQGATCGDGTPQGDATCESQSQPAECEGGDPDCGGTTGSTSSTGGSSAGGSSAGGNDLPPSRPPGPAQCGDGVIGGYEECDDANRAGGDGCSSDCKLEFAYDCHGEPTECVASGLPPETPLGQLTQQQAETWCLWVLNILREPNNTVYCGDRDNFYNTRSVADCAAYYVQGLKSGQPWWCAHSDGHVEGSRYSFQCAGEAGGTSPLAGCTAQQAESQILTMFSDALATDDIPAVLDYRGPCALFAEPPGCSTRD